MPHDFKKFPELRNEQFDIYYFQSPHRQITEDFNARVERIIDGDTIEVSWQERDFKFPVRMAGTSAPELNERGGLESALWLRNQCLGKEVEIKIDFRNRVGKFGRIIGEIILDGLSLNQASKDYGAAVEFQPSGRGEIPDISSILKRYEIK